MAGTDNEFEYSLSWCSTSVSSVFTHSYNDYSSSASEAENVLPTPARNNVKPSKSLATESESSVLSTQDLLLPPNLVVSPNHKKPSQPTVKNKEKHTIEIKKGDAEEESTFQPDPSCIEISICPRFVRVAPSWNKKLLVVSTSFVFLGILLLGVALVLRDTLVDGTSNDEPTVSEVVAKDPKWLWEKTEDVLSPTQSPSAAATLSLEEWPADVIEEHGRDKIENVTEAPTDMLSVEPSNSTYYNETFTNQTQFDDETEDGPSRGDFSAETMTETPTPAPTEFAQLENLDGYGSNRTKNDDDRHTEDIFADGPT